MTLNLGTTLRLRKLDRDLSQAATYAEWFAIAGEHDRLSGASDWQASGAIGSDSIDHLDGLCI